MYLQVPDNTTPIKAKWTSIILVLVSMCAAAGYLPNSYQLNPPPQTELFHQFVLDTELTIMKDDSPSLKVKPLYPYYLCWSSYRFRSFVQDIAEQQYLAKQEQILFSINQHLRQQLRTVHYSAEDDDSLLL